MASEVEELQASIEHLEGEKDDLQKEVSEAKERIVELESKNYLAEKNFCSIIDSCKDAIRDLR